MPASERRRELKRRRHRRKKMGILARKAKNGTAGDKALVAQKLRALTPGAEVLIRDWELE